jgi:hypothetical protein
MRRTHQSQWQDIQFSDFAKLSSTKLAGPEFYQAFYKEFFTRYRNWEQLSPGWRMEKERCARFILAHAKGSKILSVGCGLGAMEHYLRAWEPQLDLSIHEVAPSAWHWIGQEFPDDHKFVGLIPACLPADVQFDLIYLSSIDYVLDDDAMIGLLSAIRPFLSKNGQCLLISASFDEVPATLSQQVASLLREIKVCAATALDMCGLRPLGQFWGWSRTRREYQTLMQRAGYQDIEEGFIDSEKQEHYWISGH